MLLGVDASNLNNGGGITHLRAFLEDSASEQRYEKIILWASHSTIKKLPQKTIDIEYRTNYFLNRSILHRLFWMRNYLAEEANQAGVNVLFVPGSLYLGKFRPFVTMCRNMLPFDNGERKKFGFSAERVRLHLLAWLQAVTFRRAERIIFLSEYARKEINYRMMLDEHRQAVIPHGITDYFRGIKHDYSGKLKCDELKLLYVSTLYPYKYQLELIGAIALMRDRGVNVQLDLVGSGTSRYMNEVLRKIHDSGLGKSVHLHGNVPQFELLDFYRQADAVVYASGCENFPNILVEAMASGVPILCSNRGPMPEVIKAAAIYFDPRSVKGIERALLQFLSMDNIDRCLMASSAKTLSDKYRWKDSFARTHCQISKVVASWRCES